MMTLIAKLRRNLVTLGMLAVLLSALSIHIFDHHRTTLRGLVSLVANAGIVAALRNGGDILKVDERKPISDLDRLLESNLVAFNVKNLYQKPHFGGFAGDAASISSLRNVALVFDRIGVSVLVFSDGTVVHAPINPPTNPNELDVLTLDDYSRNRLEVYTRVLDTEIVEETDNTIRIYMAHHIWLPIDAPEKLCKSTRLSRSKSIAIESFLVGNFVLDKDDWEPVFDARPCLEIEFESIEDGVVAAGPLKSNRTGGQLVQHEDMLIMSIGDVNLDGKGDTYDAAQRDTVDYGKFISIDLESMNASVFAKGTRNAQGLVRDTAGRLVATEHGPQGGDEMNIVRQGKNYGWAKVTYGVDYGAYEWVGSKYQGHHEGFEEPIYAWTPSIGVSAITQANSSIKEWEGDFLVASKKAGTIYRIKLKNGSVRHVEAIPFGERIAAIHHFADGPVLIATTSTFYLLEPLKTAGATLSTITDLLQQIETEPKTKEALLYCASCHSFEPSRVHDYPAIGVVFGKGIGNSAKASEADIYSEALLKMDGIWDEETLVDYLSDPQSFAPGTTKPTMNFSPDTLRKVANFLRISSGCFESRNAIKCN